MERADIRLVGSHEVVVSGEIDLSTAPALREAINAAGPGVQIDLRDCRFMDSTGVATLIDAHDHAVANNATLRLVAPSDAVTRLLEICGLTEFFHIETVPATTDPR